MSGRVRVVVITGAPAVGKTTVAQQLARCYIVPTAMVDTDWLGNVWPWQENDELLDLIADNMTSTLPRFRSWGAQVIVVSGVLLPGRVLSRIAHLLESTDYEWVFYALRASSNTLMARVATDFGVQDSQLRASMANLDSLLDGLDNAQHIQTDDLDAARVLRSVLGAEHRSGAPIKVADAQPSDSCEPDQVRIGLGDCVRLVERALEARGVAGDVARDCAITVVDAEQKGYPSHGLIRVFEYCSGLDSGEIDPMARPHVTYDGCVTFIDGRGALGAHVLRHIGTALTAVRGSDRAHFVRVANGGHLGRLGTVAAMAAKAGVIVLGFANYSGTGQKVAPAGSGRGRLGTNPIVFAFPTQDDRPVVVDMSTSAWSEGAVRVRASANTHLPSGVLIDRLYAAVHDPARLYAETAAGDVALAPLGTGPSGTAHKGYALAVMAELLGGAVGGRAVSHSDAFHGTDGNSALFIAFDPTMLGVSLDQLDEDVRALEGHLSRAQPIDPRRPVRLPGRGDRGSNLTYLEVPSGLLQRLRELVDVGQL